MTDFIKEMEELQRRMAELERQKEEHEAEEYQKKTSMKHNLSIFGKQLLTQEDLFNQYKTKEKKEHRQVQQLIQEEQQRLQRIFQEEHEITMRQKGSRNCPLSKRGIEIKYEIDCLNGRGPTWDRVTAQTVYNMLKIIDNRLATLEQNM
jgi:DNA-binding protein H-NS